MMYKDYHHQTMVFCINTDMVLREIYFEKCKVMEIKDALKETWDERINNSSVYDHLWNEMKKFTEDNNQTETPFPTLPENQVVKDVKQLVEKYGWKVFISGVADYAGIRARDLAKVGLLGRAGPWKDVHDRVMSASRRRVDQ